MMNDDDDDDRPSLQKQTFGNCCSSTFNTPDTLLTDVSKTQSTHLYDTNINLLQYKSDIYKEKNIITIITFIICQRQLGNGDTKQNLQSSI